MNKPQSHLYHKGNAEQVNKLWVKCCVCNQKTYEGIKQSRFYSLENGRVAKMNLYMCERCFLNGEKWPGIKPHTGMSNQKIQGQFDRFKDNTKLHSD